MKKGKETNKDLSQDLSKDDEDSIFNDVGRIRNRDEIATDGNRIVQGGSASDIDDTWEFERKHLLRGDRSESPEAVDGQLRSFGALREDLRESDSHRRPTVAKPATDNDVLKNMSEEDLHSIADTLGIPDRDKLSHKALVSKIREYEARGL